MKGSEYVQKVKSRKKIILLLVIILLIVMFYIFYLSKWVLYRRLQIELPKDIEIVEMDANIGIKSVFRIENEKLSIKFSLKDDQAEEFIDKLEDVGYYTYPEAIENPPHPENVVDSWDFDYDKLEILYSKEFARNKIFVSRCHIYVFITESEEGIRDIYIDYTG